MVSVVIPTYNYGRFVTEAVDCALNQTYRPLEVIVVDDGSTDNTRPLLAPYLDRIRYVHQANKGLSAARNTGIRHAQGQWVAFLDADDLWHPDKTRVQLDLAGIDASVGLVGSPYCTAMPTALPDRPATRVIGIRDFLFGVPIAPSATLVRREAFELVGDFDETLSSVEDRDMWLRLSVAVNCLQVATPCWRYRDHPGQMSRNAQRMFDNYLRVLTRFFSAHPEFAPDRRSALACMHLDAAISFFAEGRRSRSLGHLMSSWSYRPWSVPVRGTEQVVLRFKLAVKIVMGAALFSRLHWRGPA